VTCTILFLKTHFNKNDMIYFECFRASSFLSTMLQHSLDNLQFQLICIFISHFRSHCIYPLHRAVLLGASGLVTACRNRNIGNKRFNCYQITEAQRYNYFVLALSKVLFVSQHWIKKWSALSLFVRTLQ